MVLFIVASGIVSGAISALITVFSGLGFLWMLASYSVGGMAGMLLALLGGVVLTSLRGQESESRDTSILSDEALLDADFLLTERHTDTSDLSASKTRASSDR
ncbi:hypothetical protein [Poseidonocella sedimentorum]|uniref:Uncharacterized protein n=1 Tax=Poseidonocella sedimentorum TaxID=871652 RepID=A0A1I6DFR7_9RHOB|nr:hypothetical protein [Poseidonocella sedimentorum]SFR04172.1 hypothetical protein SAMN04515673_103130 [Poseidonocella sedimentorum]